MSSSPPDRSEPKSPRAVAAVEPELLELLGPPPLYEGESAVAYQQLHERLRAAVSPKDVIEELWVRDVAELFWDSLRFRRLKAKLMVSARSEGLSVILERLVTIPDPDGSNDDTDDVDDTDKDDTDDVDTDGDDTDQDDGDAINEYDDFESEDDFDVPWQTRLTGRRNRLHFGWLRGDSEAKEEIDQLLKQAGYDWQVVEAEALRVRLDDLDRIDRMIMRADTRRDTSLREIDRHRDVVARRLRDAIADVEDAEFVDVALIDGEATA